MKKLLIFLLFPISSFLFPNPVSAATDFTTDFASLYTIDQNGDTQVQHTIKLTNNLAHIYATSYSLATAGESISQIVASDEYGPLTTSTITQRDGTTINLEIARPAIGQNQAKTLVISYHTKGVVERIGESLVINIPRLAKAGEVDSYSRTVRVMGVADKPALITPPANTTQAAGPYTSYSFLGHERDSLSLLFGDSVTYELNLAYELTNSTLSQVDSELALPPDTSYQHITLASIDPQPLSIHLDQDGNWLARYKLSPQQKLAITAKLYATVYPTPKLFDPSNTQMPHTKDSRYWHLSPSQVQEHAENLKDPLSIYDYLVTGFTYDYAGSQGSTTRRGADPALTAHTSLLCTEFTDIFVALSRERGIPSREINGYAYSSDANSRPPGSTADILHAWPEYYDTANSVWVAIDPTWGNTTGGIDYFHKLDFSHITFVRHGIEDSYPIPAGAYKNSKTDKQIQVGIALEPPNQVTNYTLTQDGDRFFVLNTGNTALINYPVEAQGTSYTIPYLPPYGRYLLPQSHPTSIYDKIKALCAKLLSRFWQPPPASS